MIDKEKEIDKVYCGPSDGYGNRNKIVLYAGPDTDKTRKEVRKNVRVFNIDGVTHKYIDGRI